MSQATDPNYASDVAAARSLLDTYGAWINKYRGGMPAGWMASIMLHESGGNFASPGDQSLGEVGFYQIAAYVPPLFGLPAEARNDPESNVAIASLEYALESVYWMLAFPDVVSLGTGDAWRLARLAFAVGRSGSHLLASLAASAFGGLTSGDVYGDIVRFVLASEGVPLGSQSAATVAKRVVDISRQWSIGQDAGSGAPGPPTLIPDPPAGAYSIPPDAVEYFVKPISGIFLLLFGGAYLAYLLWNRK
jgi:hypothetical protein